MRKFRLLSTLTAVAILVASLAACSGTSQEGSKDENNAAESNNDQTEAATDISTDSEASSQVQGSSESNSTAAGTDEETASGDTVDFIYVVPGDEPKDLAGGEAAVNEKLATDQVGVALDLKYIPWDAWDQKINLMLSTGDKFDAFQVMNDRVSLSNYASRGALTDITDLLQQYGSNILNEKNNPDIMLKSVEINDRMYAIPAYWVESALDPEIEIRKDILDKYNLPVPTTFEELTDEYETVMASWEGAQKPYLPTEAMSNFGMNQKTYDEWPFVVYDQIFYVDQSGSVKNFYETDVFKQNAENAKLWFDKGLISPDILTTTSDQKANQLNSGDWFVLGGTIGSITNLKTNYPDITVDDLISLDFAPDKPRVRPYGTRNMNAVPASSEHPEATVKFFNWILESQENYDLFMYGREGTDYETTGDRTMSAIIDPSTNAAPYYFSDWMAGNINFIRYSDSAPTATIQSLYTINQDAVEGYAAMFTFDASAVQTQYTDVQTQISAVIKPIASGVMDYDSNIDSALQALKAAGVDDLIAEFQKQLDASKK